MASLPCRWGVPLGFAVLLTVLWGLVAPALATEAAGTVLAVNPNGFAERAGGHVPLVVKEAVHVGDTLTTDATGRVRILLRDDPPCHWVQTPTSYWKPLPPVATNRGFPAA